MGIEGIRSVETCQLQRIPSNPTSSLPFFPEALLFRNEAREERNCRLAHCRTEICWVQGVRPKKTFIARHSVRAFSVQPQ